MGCNLSCCKKSCFAKKVDEKDRKDREELYYLKKWMFYFESIEGGFEKQIKKNVKERNSVILKRQATAA